VDSAKLNDWMQVIGIFPGLRKVFEANQKFNTSLDAARGGRDELIPWTSRILYYLEKYDEETAPIPDTKEYIFRAF
jgi:hypothetical protein